MPLKYLVILLLVGFEMLAAPGFGRSGENSVVVSLSKGIPITGKERFLAPKWSPDGRCILLTKGKYRGLYILALEDKAIRELSGSPGVGFAAKWSLDGRFIITLEEGDRKIIDLNGEPVASEKAGLKEYSADVVARDDAIYLRNNITRQENKISQGEDRFFMPQLSPDRKKVAYIGLSSGIHIKNLENGIETVIGLGTDIAWMPDSKGIIYTYSQDDGHKITASDIFFADVDTRKSINLTNTPNRLESHAAPSPEGTELSYVVDGQVFLSELTCRRP